VLKNLDAAIDGVAPPGWEYSIKKMKNESTIDNPFALAWFMKNHGAKPALRGNEMHASADETALWRTLMRQQDHIPPVCLAAARGETWAQAQLLDPQCPRLMMEGRW
jgi:hypothetical protein